MWTRLLKPSSHYSVKNVYKLTSTSKLTEWVTCLNISFSFKYIGYTKEGHTNVCNN